MAVGAAEFQCGKNLPLDFEEAYALRTPERGHGEEWRGTHRYDFFG